MKLKKEFKRDQLPGITKPFLCYISKNNRNEGDVITEFPAIIKEYIPNDKRKT